MNNTFKENTLSLDSFIDFKESKEIFDYLTSWDSWDCSMKSRKTLSFGQSYNYNQMFYPFTEIPKIFEKIITNIENLLNWKPNNILINWYEDGNSSMGWHSDNFEILEDLIGVVILSLGDERIIKFREIDNKENKMDILLKNGSLFYMNGEIQKYFNHSIPKTNSNNSRISLTFRKIKNG